MSEQWKLVASMEAIRSGNPDWTEDQCRAEFNRLSNIALQEMLRKEKTGKRSRS